MKIKFNLRLDLSTLKYFVVGEEYILAAWYFTPEQRAENQSWSMEQGYAVAGQTIDGVEIPEDTIVRGYLFEDEGGHYIKYRDDNHVMQKVYVKSDSIDYGMFPSAERNQRFWERWKESGLPRHYRKRKLG